MFKRFFARFEFGQALVEYMPTIAGMMALGTITLIWLGGGVTNVYCEIVDAFGDTPDVCIDTDLPGSSDGSESPSDTPSDTPEDSNEDPIEAVCTITLDSAEGAYPEGWNTEWTNGEADTLRVNVSGLTEPVDWSLKLRFPTDPTSMDTEVKTGTFAEDGEYEITLDYPAEGSWGPTSTDGYGTYESHATLHIADPCDNVGWDRWYSAPWTADLEIGITHDVSPVKVVGETLTYTVTVTNHGPNAAQVYNDEGTVVHLPVPSGVTVLSATPSQGFCDTQIVCDLGELPVQSSATIAVVTTVADPVTCELTGTASVSAPRPPDPDTSNNEASTYPWCETETVVCVTENQLGVATDFNVFIFGDFTSSTDTEGRLAVGNNAYLTGYRVGEKLSSAWNGKDVLVVGNNLTFNGGEVANGDVTVGGSAISRPTITNGSLKFGTPINFSAASTELQAISSAFASAEANGSVNFQSWGSLDLVGTDEQLNVFNVSQSEFKAQSQVRIEMPEGATALINVAGSSVSFPTWEYTVNGNSSPNSRVLFNLPGATNVTISGSVKGSILAPNANITANNGAISGTVISKSFNGPNEQTNHVPFMGCVPPVTN